MPFEKWLSELDRIFVERFWIDHVMGGFSEEEMIRDWMSGEAPGDWVERIGEKYDLDECDEQGLKSWR
tara:strand:+ start:287 stop:490 length:204 start_codon:yes stop_codon:yes gene_type:complete